MNCTLIIIKIINPKKYLHSLCRGEARLAPTIIWMSNHPFRCLTAYLTFPLEYLSTSFQLSCSDICLTSEGCIKLINTGYVFI